MIIREHMPITEDDEIKIFVIGYRFQGESIIITIGNSKTGYNKFVGVVDCYKTKKHFVTKEILEECSVKKLDFICWTHADWDHTYGIASLSKFIKKDTAFILPEELTASELNISLAEELGKDRYRNEYKNIFDIVYNRIDIDNFITAGHNRPIYSFKMVQDAFEYDFFMTSFSPITKIVRQFVGDSVNSLYNCAIEGDTTREWYVDSKRKNNLFSVGLHITLKAKDKVITICLCSDLDNITIDCMSQQMKDRYFKNNTILKIPHHCSSNSDSLLNDECIGKFEYGVTTSYRLGHLPNEEILQKYKDKSVKGVTRTDAKTGAYGVVSYSYRISDLDFLGISHELGAGIF